MQDRDWESRSRGQGFQGSPRGQDRDYGHRTADEGGRDRWEGPPRRNSGEQAGAGYGGGGADWRSGERDAGGRDFGARDGGSRGYREHMDERIDRTDPFSARSDRGASPMDRHGYGGGRGDGGDWRGRDYDQPWDTGRGALVRDGYARQDYGYRQQPEAAEYGGRGYDSNRTYAGEQPLNYARGGRVDEHRQGTYSRLSGGGFGSTSDGQKRRYPKGPKGYTRSDERIKEDVCDCISRADELDSSDIEVTVTKGEVTLAGTVPDRQMKFFAEQLCENVSAVTDVTNNLRVKRQDDAQRSARAGNGSTGSDADASTRRAPTAKA